MLLNPAGLIEYGYGPASSNVIASGPPLPVPNWW